jgi:hypothetical protein
MALSVESVAEKWLKVKVIWEVSDNLSYETKEKQQRIARRLPEVKEVRNG